MDDDGFDLVETCPHCKEPINSGSACAPPGMPWHHIRCLQSSSERTTEVVDALHRLSRAELATVIEQATQLLDDPKWRR